MKNSFVHYPIFKLFDNIIDKNVETVWNQVPRIFLMAVDFGMNRMSDE